MPGIKFDLKGFAVEFRPMTVDDYEKVRDLVPDVSRCNKRFSKKEFQALLSIPTFHPWCSYRLDTNNLVGYAELHRIPHIGRDFDGRIERVVVSKDFRGQGLGTAMCKYLIQQAKEQLNCGRVELTVEKPDARHIYETKLQFAPVDTTVMRLLLKDPGKATKPPANELVI